MKEKGLFERELFRKALKNEPGFSKYRLKDLETLGNFLARNPAIFKRIYKTYRNRETNVEIEGSSLNIVFDWESWEAGIGDSKAQVKFELDLFLELLRIADLCLVEFLPVGSIVEVDLDILPEATRGMMSQARAMIVNQKAMLHKEADYLYVDYVANLWPHASQGNIPPLFLSNVMIKRVIHKGYTTDEEREYIQNVKEVIVNARQKSITFISEKELEKLEKDMMIASEKEGEAHA